jgi:molybdopterin converting factor small subunit
VVTTENAKTQQVFRVKLFGPLAKLAQTSEAEVAVTSEAPTVDTLRSALSVKYPSVADALMSCRFALNHAFVEEKQSIKPADELAVIGMVSGG